MQYTLFVFLAPAAAAVMALVLAYAVQRRATPGAKGLIFYLGVVAGFLVGNTLELVDPTPSGTLFWAKFSYFFITSLPVTWLAFTLDYTGQKRWLARRRFWVFGLIPLATFLLALTTEMHGLIWQNYRFIQAGRFLALDVDHGPWFWVDGIYNYSIMLFGAFVMVREHFFHPAPPLYRRRTALLAAGGIFPLTFNLMYVFHLVPGWHKDYTPLAFALAGVFFALVLFRYRLLDLMPVARSLLVEELPDGMLLIDRQRRVVDCNPAARGILGIAGDPTGQMLEAVWPQSRDYLAFPSTENGGGDGGAGAMDSLTRPDVMVLQRGNLRMSFSLRVMPVGEGRRRSAIHRDPQGWMILLTDVTRRVEAERGMMEANAALRRLNEDLEARIRERTLALSERAAELEALSRVSVALRRAAGMEELLRILLDEAVANVKAAAGAIFVLEEEDLVLRAVRGMDGRQLGTVHPRRGAGAGGPEILWQVIDTGQLLRCEGLPGPMAQLAVDLRGPIIVVPIRAGLKAGAPRVLGLMVVCFDLAAQTGALPEQTAGAGGLLPPTVEGAEMVEADVERLLTAIAEVGSNAFQRVRAMENLEQLVQSRTRHLSTLYEITSVTNQYMALPDLLDGVLRIIQTVLGLRAVTLHIINDPAGLPVDAPGQAPANGQGAPNLYLAAWVGLEAAAARALPGPERADSPWQMALARGAMVMLPDVAENLAAIALPVRAKGQQLGVLSVLDETTGHFSVEDMALLGAIADQVGVAVESAQLREGARQKAEEAAVMEERQRLARDLHDSVTQSLYSLVLFSEAVKDDLVTVGGALTPLRSKAAPSLSGGEGEKEDGGEGENEGGLGRAMENLERLREAGQQALKEMRLLIYELRPQALARDGLVGALRSRLEMVERRAGVRARLEVADLFPLPDAVETGLFGIAQEALNNVLKHAQASEVVVRLEGGAAGAVTAQAQAAGWCITLEVRDNGIGFPPGILDGTEERSAHGASGDRAVDGGVGLNSMRERARQMGGTIAITSQAGRGARVVVRVAGIAES